jgi:purine-binding chemotaxis protein CheW
MMKGAPAESRERTAEILRARARALAGAPGTGKPAAGGKPFLEFGLGDERYAVRTAQVLAVRLLGDYAPLPCAPAMVVGVVNHLGRLFSVIDLGILFGWPARRPGRLDKVVLLHDAEMELGIRVDAVTGIRNLLPEEIRSPPPALAAAARVDCLKGLAGDGLIVLDARKLLLDNRIRVHEDAG